MSEFKKLRPSEIEIDPRFNRDLDQARAKEISVKIDLNLIGVPVISERANGKKIVIDAQHRITGCRMAGYDEPLLCEVHYGLTLQEEAALFLKLNGGRTAVGLFDKFKAQLVARDPVALDIDKIVKASGLRISKAPGNYSVCAIRALVNAYHKGNLHDVLKVLMQWSAGEASFLEGLLIKALSIFLAKYPDVNLAEFAKKLQPYAAERVIAKLKRMQGAFADVSPTIAACSVFRDIYNERRRSNKLPPPDSLEDGDEEMAAE